MRGLRKLRTTLTTLMINPSLLVLSAVLIVRDLVRDVPCRVPRASDQGTCKGVVEWLDRPSGTKKTREQPPGYSTKRI
ncbi:hypothetical protein F4801DRAFT_535823 [Xylaria longipes]|nr:hypothetical protein F4801DRAFT_535823 [Xylaria longipes]